MAPSRLLLRQHQHADADHQRHDHRALPDVERAEIHVAHLRQHLGGALAAEHQAEVLAQHGIGAGDISRGELLERRDAGGLAALFDEELGEPEPADHIPGVVAILRRAAATRC